MCVCVCVRVSVCVCGVCVCEQLEIFEGENILTGGIDDALMMDSASLPMLMRGAYIAVVELHDILRV